MAFDQGVNSNNVFVGNLAWATSSDRLREHFSQVGTVINAEVKYGRDGRSRGCGVVEFDSAQASLTAISRFNETDLDGRTIFVREDRDTPKPAGRVAAPKASGPRSSAPVAGSAAAGGVPNGRRLFVGNLAWTTTDHDLQEHMVSGGGVISARVMVNESNGRSKGYGIVEMATQQDAMNAIQTLNNTELNGRSIFVREDQKA
jgi:RNA recognition motif-containing protein